MNYCKDCKWFTDGHYSKTYISPTCKVRGTDSAAYMRAFVCGVENPTLYEPKSDQPIGVVDERDIKKTQHF
jgi:hypothetical protein